CGPPSPKSQSYAIAPEHWTRAALARNGTSALGKAAVGTSALPVSMHWPAVVVRATVPSFESVEPSQAAYVNESAPTKPGSGKYVAVLLLRLTVPCTGCEMTRNERVLPFGSEPVIGI